MTKCPKCDGIMQKAGVMHSGNSDYEIKKCDKCGHEEMECKGLS